MTTNSIATYLKYANLQMAAESLFGRTADKAPGWASSSLTLESLELGNNRASRFTHEQSVQFLKDGWIAVEHKSNTTTGFSGTLFKYTGPTDATRGLIGGELVLSFRSTEFVDDAVRDSKSNELEIKQKGWAFGQIDDMEAWYASLRSRGLVPAGQKLVGNGLACRSFVWSRYA